MAIGQPCVVGYNVHLLTYFRGHFLIANQLLFMTSSTPPWQSGVVIGQLSFVYGKCLWRCVVFFFIHLIE